MALPTQTAYGFVQIPNHGFESGATLWTTGGTANIVNEAQISGSWCVKTAAAGEFNDGSVTSTTKFPVVPGMAINITAAGQMTTGTPGTGFSVGLNWYDASGAFLTQTGGPLVNRAAIRSALGSASFGGSPPGDAAYVSPVGSMNTSDSATVSTLYMDNFSWNYNFPVQVNLSAPGPNYTDADEVPFRINVTGLPDGVTVTQVEYFYMTWDGADYIDATSLGVQTDSPFAYNAPAFADGQYGAYAQVTLSTGLEITSNSRVFVVGATPPSDTREYKASNSYTFLVGENFAGLGASLPTTAVVTGAEVEIVYDLEVLTRAMDIGITDSTMATATAIFDMVNTGTVEAVLLDKNGSNYSISGAAMTATVPISQADFSISEEGISDGKKWAVFVKDAESTVVIGDDNLLFGQTAITAPDFVQKALGVRFFPVLGTKPSYADDGDACIRFKINTLKLRVYFDAGSVEYYFTNGSCVIKGVMNAVNVLDGDLATGDASGIMQLDPVLEIMDGTCDTILDNWTIHSFYPPTATNQIGVVSQDMEYNGLPTYEEVEANRSRYLFITANFYGDPLLDSIYGVNGVHRAFAYNGDYFYKIYTQPDPEKDKPRHVAFHHSHLALGFGEGRVDLSVVGEPYNFDGADGASSWAVSDQVTGLIPLSGTVLGVFCQKSVVGLSGTTVDNFATQTISAKLGAVEYTVADMGFPVYANSYGIYTLSQTQQYGDFLGSPLSQQVSPWLRPRLVRKPTSDKEVVVAWPVRSKNQYKLAFADGYVLTMTMNYGTQQAPTFSKQKYFLQEEGEEISLEATSIVPAAISSELDEGGEERIHIANKRLVEAPPVPPEELLFFEYTFMSGGV